MAHTTATQYACPPTPKDLETNFCPDKHRHPRRLCADSASHWLPLRTPALPLRYRESILTLTQGTNTPALRTPTLLNRLNLPLNAGTFASLTYSTLYLLLSPNIAGLSATPLLLSAAAMANKLTTRYDRTNVNSIAIGVHVVSWILQFVGHGKFEGRKPALLDNLVQALFLAPLFVWYEVLFKLGFYGQLKRDVEAGIEAEVAKLGKGKGRAGE